MTPPLPATATASDVRSALTRHADPERAVGVASFFQARPGGYGEGDVFLGLNVPTQRGVAKEFADLAYDEVRDLLDDVEHEHRLTALFIAVGAFRKAGKPRTRDDDARRRWHELYLDALRAGCIDNWDLVDSSVEALVGEHLRSLDPVGNDTTLLTELVTDEHLWRRRAGIVATFAFVKAGEAEPTFDAAVAVLDDRRDLIQKASGWMLREVGKRISRDLLVEFLTEHAAGMGRTTLSYATEHLDASLRTHLRQL
ncbi:DNA alkylation repair protein [Nocardioides yefusunii]|uniref:DNA alkylation repair protein n=1 Tax=Nocardioides yefusunii TaxID=2500546 RepID=A0ABW1R338_9ACTN|nr:DNA alkylation repair protein [Nocardioides yefusunii]